LRPWGNDGDSTQQERLPRETHDHQKTSKKDFTKTKGRRGRKGRKKKREKRKGKEKKEKKKGEGKKRGGQRRGALPQNRNPIKKNGKRKKKKNERGKGESSSNGPHHRRNRMSGEHHQGKMPTKNTKTHNSPASSPKKRLEEEACPHRKTA